MVVPSATYRSWDMDCEKESWDKDNRSRKQRFSA